MYEISVTPEFERWYQALDAAVAERVAPELDLLERMGPELDAEKASRLLLWFDGMQGFDVSEAVPDDPARRTPLGHVAGVPISTGPGGQPAILISQRLLSLRRAEGALAHLTRQRHAALGCLETPAFSAAFARLDPARARRAQSLIETLRARVRAATLQINLRHLQRSSKATASGSSLVSEAHLGEWVHGALLAVLECVGLSPADVADTTSGLRELGMRDITPGLRLIYGLDAPRKHILAILGEPLDRAYYGNSVRLAERRWHEYCRTAARQTASP